MANPCFCVRLKTGCYMVGILFIITTGCNLSLSLKNLESNYSRSLQVNVGFQIIFLMPCLPFLVGVFFEARELLVPFMVTATYSVLLGGVMIANPDMPRDVMFFASWAAIILCHLYFVVVVGCFWKQITRRLREDAMKQKKIVNSYPYRRFGDYNPAKLIINRYNVLIFFQQTARS